MPIVWVQNFILSQYLESVNYNMDKNPIFRVPQSEKTTNSGIWCRSPNIRLNIWGPQNLRLNI